MILNLVPEYNIQIFEQLASTNDYILDNLLSLPNKSCIVANKQTAGRGMSSNLWVSRDNIDLTCSVLYSLEEKLNYKISPLVMSLAVVNTYQYFGIKAYVKWSNDIYSKDQLAYESCQAFLKSAKVLGDYIKISGILVEARTINNKHYLVVGAGLDNIMLVDRDKILEQLLIELDKIYNFLLDLKGKIIDQWLECCIHYQKIIHVLDKQNNQIYIGKHIGVNEITGALVLKVDTQIVEIVNGKIVHIEF